MVESIEKYLARKEHAEAREKQADARAQAEADGREFRAQGPGFSVPIPEGFTRIVHEETLAGLGEDGFGFVRDGSARDGRPATSIFIAREPMEAAPVPDTPGACEATARNAMATLQGRTKLTPTLVSSEFVEVGGTERCRYTVKVDDKDYVSTSTLMTAGKNVWWFTCNRDRRDSTALATCDEMLHGWKGSTSVAGT